MSNVLRQKTIAFATAYASVGAFFGYKEAMLTHSWYNGLDTFISFQYKDINKSTSVIVDDSFFSTFIDHFSDDIIVWPLTLLCNFIYREKYTKLDQFFKEAQQRRIKRLNGSN